MKKLLLLFSISLFGMNTFAQATSCATATTITESGTFVVPDITSGTYPGTICWNPPTTAPIPEVQYARWYKFTPSSGGIMSITSAIPANVAGSEDNPGGTDSRLSIYTGTCVALVCFDGSDDVSATDYRSAVIDVEVEAGVTYYISWDNRWKPDGFTFDFTYLAATCFSVSGFVFITPPTTTTASIGWNAPTGGTSPVGFQLEYGVQGFTQGTAAGTIVNPTLAEVDFVDLSSSTIYDFYVRSFCGGSDYSLWVGPISFVTDFEPATPPYAMPFEQGSFEFLGWTAPTASVEGSTWQLINNPTLAQGGARFAASVSNQSDTSDARLFSRGVNLVAGFTYTVNYWVRNFVSNAAMMGLGSYQLTMGTTPAAASQTTVLNTEPALANLEFEERTVSVPVTTTGTYFFSFLNDSGLNFEADIGIQVVLVDSFSISLPLSVGDVLSNKFSVYPNPSSNVISISNTENINVNGIQITDLNGRIVKDLKYVSTPNVSVTIADLAAGMYMMNITSDQGTAVKKIIKN